MKRERADHFRFVSVERRDDYVYPWVCVYERYRTRLMTTGKTRLAAMKEAVKLSNQALAHELTAVLRDRESIK